MPASFWIFLIICFASFVVALDDHGEAWGEFQQSTGCKKCWKGTKVFTLWLVCLGSLIGTLVLGWESKQSDKKDEQRDAQYGEVTNQLAQVISEYNQATNALAMATNAAAAAQKAVAPKSPKQQLIELLNSLDAQILPSLKSHPKMLVEGDMTESQYELLRTLAAKPGLSEYISFPQVEIMGFGTTGTHVKAKFEIYSSLGQ